MNGADLRQALHDGRQVVGTMTFLCRNPRWAQVYADLDLDYVIIDTEQSPSNRSEVADFAAALAGVGIAPIVRVPEPDPHLTIMALDGGAHGVLVPYCETPEEVKRVVAAARLRPLKGALHERARDKGEFPSEATRLHLEERNRGVVVMIGIESPPAVENLEAILDIPGIDVIFIGPNDLSVSMGLPDEPTHPEFERTVRYVIETAEARGIAAGGHWFSAEQVQQWQAIGSRFLLFNNDIRALTAGYQQALASFRS